jgi:poly-gamma-glutamate capsule biosynthesis protein CapA/YwtB (metallophosphatase superfamily)
MHPENVRILSEAAVDIAVIGNNHILDWGYSGLMDTMDILGENKILYAGAGPDSRSASMPAVYDTGNGRVLVFSYAMRNTGVIYPSYIFRN